MKPRALATPRCVLFERRGRRCHRRAALVRMGDLFVCTRHGVIALLLLDDALSAATRRRLAITRWRTFGEAQQLVNQWKATAR